MAMFAKQLKWPSELHLRAMRRRPLPLAEARTLNRCQRVPRAALSGSALFVL